MRRLNDLLFCYKNLEKSVIFFVKAFTKKIKKKKKVFTLPFLYLYHYDNILKTCYQTFKKRRIEIPDPIEPIKIPITNNRIIISGLNISGEIIERF